MIDKLIRRIIKPLFVPFAEQIVLLRKELAAEPEADRLARKVLMLEIPEELVSDDWSTPLSIRFQRLPGAEAHLDVRSLDAEVTAFRQAAAERAARQ